MSGDRVLDQGTGGYGSESPNDPWNSRKSSNLNGRVPSHEELTFEFNAVMIADEMIKLLVRKQNDYGPLNIAAAPGGPLNGLRVRLFDKIQRLSNLVDTGAEPENESLEDTFKDIANYGIIGLMVLRGDWPTLEKNDARNIL